MCPLSSHVLPFLPIPEAAASYFFLKLTCFTLFLILFNEEYMCTYAHLCEQAEYFHLHMIVHVCVVLDGCQMLPWIALHWFLETVSLTLCGASQVTWQTGQSPTERGQSPLDPFAGVTNAFTIASFQVPRMQTFYRLGHLLRPIIW